MSSWFNSAYRNLWFAMGSILLFVVVSVCSTDVLPLYDGVGFPDEAYKYVEPLSGSAKTNSAPQPVVTSVSLRQGRNIFGVGMQSNENGPQVVIFIERRAIQTTTSATTMTVSAAPVAPENMHPVGDGYLAGNVYRIGAKVDGTATYTPDQHSFVDLRLPQNYVNNAQMYFRADSSQSWQKLTTKKTGNDIYETRFNGFGDYALSSRKVAASSIRKQNVGWKISAALTMVAVVIVGIIVITRRGIVVKRKSKL